MLGFSAVAMLLVYRPYSSLAHGLVLEVPVGSLAPWIFAELYHPEFWNDARVTCWMLLLVACGISLLAVLARMVYQRRERLTFS